MESKKKQVMVRPSNDEIRLPCCSAVVARVLKLVFDVAFSAKKMCIFTQIKDFYCFCILTKSCSFCSVVPDNTLALY